MSVYCVQAEKGGFHAKLWRGERMALLGFDVLAPEDDFVGFAIEVKSPGSRQYWPLRNRLAFDYNNTGVTGARVYSSLDAPFQKFRWLHFPKDPRAGTYSYRVTKMHMPRLETLVAGTQLVLDLDLDPISLPGFLDVGFTRNFASSQAYAERFGNNPNIIPKRAAEGLAFDKSTQNPDVYDWLGFEALALLKETLAKVIADPDLSLDVLAYDLNEPDLVAAFEQLGPRLRIVIDDSGEHAEPHSAESLAAERLRHKAGPDHVTRTHFIKLQHHKVLIVSRKGVPEAVVCGSTNFTFRGLYIQANNLLRFQDPGIAGLFSRMFEVAFTAPETFKDHPLAKMWHA
ncbi:MAG: phospholipase D-like domain-containing protein, partial [Asticcacaulis sp.]